MTLKFTQLEEFKKHLVKCGFTKEISDTQLDFEIARFFNKATKFSINSVKEALGRFGFIQLSMTSGIWYVGNQKEDEEIDKRLRR